MDRADHHDVQARVEAAVAATECGPSSLPGVDPMLGRVVDGRFEILARIGAGGMGIVYRARQVGIDRTVAVKMLLRELAHDEKVIKRFKVEALAVSRLNHPNTIRIFDFGQADDGTLFFAMEFLDGSSLDDALRRDKTFSARRTMHVLKQIAASLVEAHEKGIVHRDLKPDNVYLTRVGDDVDFVKVLDFGVAKLREADKRQGTVTQAGTIFGTPRYMAPEQCRSMAVDHRADIYALGVIAYEMLVGHAPFDAENPLAILIQHVQEPPPSLAEARPDVEVPDEVEALVLKCLEKSADRRFQNASQLVSAISEIEAHLAGRFERVVYVQGPRQTLATQSRQEAETMAGVMPARVGHRARWAWLAAVLMVAFSGIGIALWTSGILGPSTQEPVQASQVPELVAPQVPVVVQQAPPLVPASVSIRFSSDPDGAEIVQRGRVLGVTPLVADVSFGRASESFTFRKGGYVDALVDTVPDRDGAVSVSLKKAAGRLRTPAQLGGVDLSSGGAPSPVAAPSTAAAPAPAASPAVVAPPLPKKDDGPARVRDLKTF
jgi:serine/threonine-protein kinase